MATIEIKNLGPVKEAKFDLNKVNVFMGPQSSGKSTIAKVISYCTWVEKRRMLDGFYRENFGERFKSFHNLGNAYFPSDAYFKYEGDYCDIVFSKSDKPDGEIIVKEGIEFENRKQIYIPAERNFVASIPNLGRYKETNNNILDFLYNWYDAKKAYPKDHVLNIPELKIRFQYEEHEDKDMILLEHNREVILQHASSGIQSMIPLYLMMDHMTDILYSKQNVPSPIEQLQKLTELRKSIPDHLQSRFMAIYNSVETGVNLRERALSTITELEEKIQEITPYELDIDDPYDNVKRQRYLDVRQELIETTDRQNKAIESIINEIIDNWSYSHSQFIIEEPEQNLFPTTQRDLIYYMMRVLNESERDHRLTFTTHSPYILYALNNCMMGSLVYDKMSDNDKGRLKCDKALINPEKVSIYQIEDGTLRKIQDEDGLIGSNYFDDKMKELMDDFYVMLNYYGK